MSIPPAHIYPTIEQILQKALEQVQKSIGGNGIKKSDITILSHTVHLQTSFAATYLELRPIITETQVAGKTVVGQFLTSRAEATAKTNEAMMMAATKPTSKSQISNILLDRPDQGFGLKKINLPAPFIKQHYTWFEPCQSCGGKTQTTCPKCMGRKTESCIKCSGRGLMPCPQCRATGLINGNKCTRCHAQRYVPCDACHKSGMMGCRTCHQSGLVICQTCHGIGQKSVTMNLTAEVTCYFEYDGKSFPKNAADAIEMHGEDLVAQRQIKIRGRIADDKENVLGANYELEFPAGEIIFKIGKHDIKAQIFGYGGMLTSFPNILDKILAKPLHALEDTLNDAGSVAQAIQNATRYRLIAKAYLLTQKTNIKRVAQTLIDQTPYGLSAGMAERIARVAYQTSARITRKPRLQGLFYGLAFVVLLCAILYLTPVRDQIGQSFPHTALDVLVEIVLSAVGGFSTSFMIEQMAGRSMRVALGHLLKNPDQSGISVKNHGLLYHAYGASFVCVLFFAFLSSFLGHSYPLWIQMLLHSIGLR